MASVLGMLLLLITTPIYLRILGPDRFGLYMLLVAVVAPFEVLNSGVSLATVKYLAAWLPEGRVAESAAMMRVGLLFNWSAGILAVIGLWFAAPWLAHAVFRIPAALQHDAIASFRLAAPLWLTIQISASLSALVVAEQNFRLTSIVQMVRAVFTYLGGIPVLYVFNSVASLQTWSIATMLPVVLFWGGEVWRRLGPTSVLPGFNRLAFQRSFGFSSWQMLNAVSGMVNQQVDRVLLGAMLGTAAVGAYGIAASIQQRAGTLIWSAFATLFPAVSRHSEATPEQAERDVLEKGGVLSLLACLAYTAGFWFAGPFCAFWLGPEQDTATVTYLLQLLFLVAILGTPSAQVAQYLLGHGLTRLNFIGNVGMAIAVAVSSYFLISRFGVKGAAVGALVGLLVSRLPLHVWTAWNHMNSGASAASRLWSIYRIPAIFSAVIAFVFAVAEWGSSTHDFHSSGLLLSVGLFFLTTLVSLAAAHFSGAQFNLKK